MSKDTRDVLWIVAIVAGVVLLGYLYQNSPLFAPLQANSINNDQVRNDG